MKRLCQIILAVFLILVVVVTTVSCGEATKTQKGGTLRLAAYSMGSLDPHTSIGGFELNYHYQNFDNLVTMKPDMSIVSGLAESWEMVDSKAIIFHLKKGVKFHDGTDFNAAAVKWNVEHVKDPDVKSPFAGTLMCVDSVEVLDNLTVKFNLNKPDASLLAALSDKAGMMVSPAAGQKYGRSAADLYDHPVGTGAWQTTEFIHDDHVTMERFTDYWDKGKPYIDKLEFKLIPDAAVALASIQAGTIDLIVPETVPLEYMAKAKDIPGVEVPTGPGLGFSIVVFNKNFEPFSNVKVRYALAWAWDRDAEIAAYGAGTPELGLLPEISWAFNPKVKEPKYSKYPANLEKAKQLLAEAGYPDGFEVKLLTINTPEYIKRGEILKDHWGKVGVRVTLDVRDLNAALTAMVGTGQFEVGMVNHSGRSDPGLHLALLNYSKSGYNKAGVFVTSQEYDDLLDKAGATLDLEARKQLYYQAQLVIMDLQPMLMGINSPVFIPVRDYVKGAVIYPDRKLRLKEVWLSK
jgi:peptide/nickel transport system substrate-binding protein